MFYTFYIFFGLGESTEKLTLNLVFYKYNKQINYVYKYLYFSIYLSIYFITLYLSWESKKREKKERDREKERGRERKREKEKERDEYFLWDVEELTFLIVLEQNVKCDGLECSVNFKLL